MASSFNLEQLMNPLKRIQIASEEINSTVKKTSLELISSSSSKTHKIQKSLIDEQKRQTVLLSSINKSLFNNNQASRDIKASHKEDKLNIKLLSSMGVSIEKIIESLRKYAVDVPEEAVQRFIRGINQIYIKLKKITKDETILKGVRYLDKLRTGISKFSKSLMFSQIFLIPGMSTVFLLRKALDEISYSIRRFGRNLLIGTVTLTGGIYSIKLITNVVKSFKELFPQNEIDEYSERSKTLQDIGKAIYSFSKRVFLSSILILPGNFAIKTLGNVIVQVGKVFRRLDKMKRVQNSITKLNKIGSGLISFAKKMSIAGVVGIVGLVAAPILAGSIYILSKAFNLLGKNYKRIREGISVLGKMGKGMALFSLGLAAFALSTMFILKEPKTLLAMAGSIVTVGSAVYLLGLLSRQIGKGALALGLMGIGLLAFGYPYKIFSESTKDLKLKDVGIQGAALTMIGTVMSVAGLVVGATGGAVLLGPLLFAGAGLALLSLGKGLEAIKKAGFTKKDSDNLGHTLNSVALGFMGIDLKKGFLDNVGNVFTRVVGSGVMSAASIGYTLAGHSLTELAKGLKDIKKVGFGMKLKKELIAILNGVSSSFSEAGEVSKKTRDGIHSTMDAGKSLNSIAKGLAHFQKLVKTGINFGSPDSKGNYKKGTLGYAITNSVGMVRSAFAAIGGAGNVQGGGFFSTLFQIKRNKVEEGISSVKDTHESLSSLAKGINSFEGVKEPKSVANKIKDSISLIADAFQIIGGAKVEKSIMWGLISWDENAFEVGLESFENAGEKLLNVSKSFKVLEEIKNPKKSAKILADLINSVPDAFGNMYKKDKNIYIKMDFFSEWTKNLVRLKEDGVLSDVADGFEDIGDAIKDIDIETVQAFDSLFENASKLERNMYGYEKLTNAVVEIRNILMDRDERSLSKEDASEARKSINENDNNIVTNKQQINDSEELSINNKKIKEALIRLNSTISNLEGTLTEIPSEIRFALENLKLQVEEA